MTIRSVTGVRERTHASVRAIVSPPLLTMAPYTEEDRYTLTGSHTIRILPFGHVFSAKATGTLLKGFVLVFVTLVGAHVNAAGQGGDLETAADGLPTYIVESGVASSSDVAPRGIVERMKYMREQRRGQREKEAAEREPVHAAAPGRIAPTMLDQKGVYLAASSVARPAFFDSALASVKEGKGNAVIFDVKGGGVLYRSGAPMATELDLVRSIYDLPAVIEKLHAEGFEVMGRFVAIKDEAFTNKRPDTRVKHPETGRTLSPWIDPANDDAIRFNMEVICELAAAGIDEINLDYIRFSTAEVGALGVFSGQEKADRLEKFIRAARETIDRCGPKTRLGLSTYAILGWSYDINVATLGQDVRRFAPLVDVISPMAYPATFSVNAYYDPAKNPGSRMYYLVYRTMMGYRELLGPEHSWKLRPWIQGYGVTTKNMQDQIKAVYDSGSCGYQVWNANNNYAPTYAAMKTQEVPFHCGSDLVQN